MAGKGINIGHFAPSDEELYRIGEKDKVQVPDDIPTQLQDMDYATYDRYPVINDLNFGDSRTDETIDYVMVKAGGTVRIALSFVEGESLGWRRWSRVDTPIFRLSEWDVDAAEQIAGESQDFWLYEQELPVDTWVQMPRNANSRKERPPFVFAPTGTLTFANPLPLPHGHKVLEDGLVTNPSMTIVPGTFDGDGDGVADGDIDGDGTVDVDIYLASATAVPGWPVFRSIDNGLTWQRWGNFATSINRQTLFWNRGGVYLMGSLKPAHSDKWGAISYLILQSTTKALTLCLELSSDGPVTSYVCEQRSPHDA